MTAELELTVVQDARGDRGYLAAFAITDQLILAAGGMSSRAPIMLASSNARHFEPRTTPRELGLRDLLVAGDAVWTCGEYGQLATSHDNGASWTLLDTGTDGCLFGMATAKDGALWVVGDHGYAARVKDEHLERIDFATTVRFASVCPVRDEIVVLAADGSLRRWRAGGEITTVATGATKEITGLAITKQGTWIVIGDGGFIARSPDGAWFSRAKSGVETDLEAISALADGRLVIVGDRGQILVSPDDGRTWTSVKTSSTAHLWSVERFGGGVLIGGDDGVILKLAPGGDQTWHDRVDVFRGAKMLDGVFAHGPDGFIASHLAEYLATIDKADAGKPDAASPGSEGDHDDRDDDGGDAAFDVLGRSGTARDFEANHGVALPPEAARFIELVADKDPWNTFEELRLDNDLLPDVGDENLFELIVRRDQRAYLGTGLVEAFCGVFCLGSQGNGDTYHLEIYEWNGPRQVVHWDHERHAFTGVFADSLDSLVYLTALSRAEKQHTISAEGAQAALRQLYGKVAPTWHFSIEDRDKELVRLDAKRRETEFFHYRSRWILALLKNDGVTNIADIPPLFIADLNQVLPAEQLTSRLEMCEKYVPTALYSMWRATLFDEPELPQYLEIGRRHAARLVRDAAKLIDELVRGRNVLGTIADWRAHLAAFRALDLDPRRAEQRKVEHTARSAADDRRKAEAVDELSRTPRERWAALAWHWLDDGVAHRALLERLDANPEDAPQLAALAALHDVGDGERNTSIPVLAAELSSELEAILVGSLLRDDLLTDALRRPSAAKHRARASTSEEHDDAHDHALDPRRVQAAVAMTARALRLAPDDVDVQFTHAMLLVDAHRCGIPHKLEELLAALPIFVPSVRINVAVRLAKLDLAEFVAAVDIVVSGDLPKRIMSEGRGSMVASYGDIAQEMFGELGEAILEKAPDRLLELVPLLPEDVTLFSDLAWKAIQAEQREAALALYDRLLALPIPDEGAARTNYLRAVNNACVQAHATKAFETAVRIADRAQPSAHENPYIYHSAACAYAAVHDYHKALGQVRLAFEHGYDHLEKLEVDSDLGPLLDWPEFKTLFREWRAHREDH